VLVIRSSPSFLTVCQLMHKLPFSIDQDSSSFDCLAVFVQGSVFCPWIEGLTDLNPSAAFLSRLSDAIFHLTDRWLACCRLCGLPEQRDS
jgi:hypothetical protein